MPAHETEVASDTHREPVSDARLPMESAISATYTALSFVHALKQDAAACLLYLVLAALYLAAGCQRRRSP